MQATPLTQARQPIALTVGAAAGANGPTPLSPELLKFIGGGMGISTTTITPSSPKSGW